MEIDGERQKREQQARREETLKQMKSAPSIGLLIGMMFVAGIAILVGAW